MTSKHSKGAGNITRMERINTQCMEAHVTADGSAYYTERSYEAHAWMCNGCGLVWEKRHQAQGCEGRKHVASYVDTYYGRGAVVNGQFTGTVTKYERKAIRRETVAGMAREIRLEDAGTVKIVTTRRGLHRFLALSGELFEDGRYNGVKIGQSLQFSSITPEDVRQVVSFEEQSPYAV